MTAKSLYEQFNRDTSRESALPWEDTPEIAQKAWESVLQSAAADEREECARIASKEEGVGLVGYKDYDVGYADACIKIGAQIRARGK